MTTPQEPVYRTVVEALMEEIRASLDANNAWEWDDSINGTQTGFDGNKDVLAEAIAKDIAAIRAESGRLDVERRPRCDFDCALCKDEQR